MLAASLKLAIEEGFGEFDFLRGDEPYKTTWNAQPVPLATWRIAGRGTSARVRRSAWRTRETVKRWIRSRKTRAAVPPTPNRSQEST
jgi:CelD/BcsL family acetyltransferase involved in cellulose biosynthesis